MRKVQVIIYSLRGNRGNSDPYCDDIAKFTDEVLAKGKKLLADASHNALAILILSPISRHSHPQPTLGHLGKLLNWEVQA